MRKIHGSYHGCKGSGTELQEPHEGVLPYLSVLLSDDSIQMQIDPILFELVDQTHSAQHCYSVLSQGTVVPCI